MNWRTGFVLRGPGVEASRRPAAVCRCTTVDPQESRWADDHGEQVFHGVAATTKDDGFELLTSEQHNQGGTDGHARRLGPLPVDGRLILLGTGVMDGGQICV